MAFSLADVREEIEAYMKEVSERRKEKKKI